MARLLFLGRLEDVAGTAEMNLSLPRPTSLPGLLDLLPPALAEALSGPRVRLALNGGLVRAEDVSVADGDELAFLPPVSGG